MDLGDTSQLNIQFSVTGSTNLALGGSPLPDTFDVTGTGEFYANENHASVDVLRSSARRFIPGLSGRWYCLSGPRFVDCAHSAPQEPLKSFNSRFTTPMRAPSRSTAAAAATHTTWYLGLGTFGNITVADSDTTTRNTLIVGLHDPLVNLDQGELTDTSFQVRYFTPTVFFLAPGLQPYGYFFTASALYSPTVFCSTNVDISARLAGTIPLPAKTFQY